MKNLKGIFLVTLFCWSASSLAQEEKWVWEKIGDEISRLLPSGQDSIEEDFKWTVWSGADKSNRMFAGSSHISTFSPTYVAATLIEAALIPFVWSYQEAKGSTEATAWISAESSKKNFENENIELKKELEESRKRESELRSRLNEQSERFIDSYDSKTKIGLVEPELKKYLQESRERLVSMYFSLGVINGVELNKARQKASDLNYRIDDIDLVNQFLASQEERI